MVRAIINGCNGRMGQTLVNAIEASEDFEVAAGVDPFGKSPADWDFTTYASLSEVKETADVVIDFSNIDGLKDLCSQAIEKKLPMVIATTGITEEHLDFMRDCGKKIAILQAANMSLGINLLKVLVKQAAEVLQDSFDIEIVERHHRMKRDAPSGTALALADVINGNGKGKYEYINGRHEKNKLRTDAEIGIHAVRGGTIVGDHDVIFAGRDEVLQLSHRAYSRSLFATGAMKAAAFIVNKAPGLYHMEDLFSQS